LPSPSRVVWSFHHHYCLHCWIFPWSHSLQFLFLVELSKFLDIC
jgi:hypothetical protein